MLRHCETPVCNRKIVSPGKSGTGLSRNTKSVIGPSISGVEMLLDLQRTHGNGFVQRLVQRKLSVSQPGDAYEQAADRVADALLRKRDARCSVPAITRDAGHGVHRKCAECKDEMERQAVDIEFAAGPYTPEASQGKRLLAHELTHVVQQTGAGGHLGGASVPALVGGVRQPMAILADGSEKRFEDRCESQASPLLQRACAGGSWRFEYDGCSLPGWVTSRLGIADKDNPAGASDTRFGTPGRYGGRPCDNHDRCYQTCGSSRAVCDAGMLGEMLSVCRRSSASARVKRDCFKWANVYYSGLVAGGGPAHFERQAQVCGCTVGGWLGI